MATATKKTAKKAPTLKTEMSYARYSTIKNNTSKLNDLKDDDAIHLFTIITTLEEAFKAIQATVDNVLRQTKKYDSQLAAELEAIEKKKLSQEEKEAEKKAAKTGYKPLERELNEELDRLSDKKVEVEFTPISRATLKKYGLLTFQILSIFKEIVNHE